MGGKRVDPAAKGKRGLLLAAAAAAVVLTVGGVTAAVLAGNDSSDNDTSNDAGKTDHTPSPSESGHSGHGSGHGESDGTDEGAGDTSGGESDLGTEAACIDEVKAAEKAVSAAQKGIANLKTHTKAHADWVAGKITEDEKKNLYVKTKLAGPDDVTRWEDALDTYEDASGGCDGVDNDCATRMTSLRTTIKEARMGMRHWDEHLTNMAAFADGDFDSTEAQRRWDKTIADMPDMTSAFDRSVRTLDQAPACA